MSVVTIAGCVVVLLATALGAYCHFTRRYMLSSWLFAVALLVTVFTAWTYWAELEAARAQLRAVSTELEVLRGR